MAEDSNHATLSRRERKRKRLDPEHIVRVSLHWEKEYTFSYVRLVSIPSGTWGLARRDPQEDVGLLLQLIVQGKTYKTFFCSYRKGGRGYCLWQVTDRNVQPLTPMEALVWQAKQAAMPA